ncbi:MAG: hypothetical protein ABFD92_05190 [Planctomycetaceae bacterium]|nr:hypothetical protein [Planctomycetaceae bacterium]
MTDIANIQILADAENVLVIVGIIIAVIISLVKKAAAKAKEAQEEQARRAQQPAQQGQGQPQRPRPRGPAADMGEDRSQALRQTLQNLGIVLEDERPPAPAPPPPLPRTQPQRPAPQRRGRPEKDLADRVDQELLHQQQRMADADSSRQRRMGAPNVRVVQEAQEAVTSPFAAVLAKTDTARSAIVLHEILSPPKAIRQGQEMWDA